MTDNIIETELSQSIETFRTLIKYLISMLSVLSVSAISLISYSIINHKTLFLGISATLPVIGIFVLKVIGSMIVPPLHTALKIETNIDDKSDFLIQTFFSYMATNSLQLFKKIIDIEDHDERMKSLRKFSGFMPLGNFLLPALLVLSFLQIIFVVILTLVFQWPII